MNLVLKSSLLSVALLVSTVSLAQDQDFTPGEAAKVATAPAAADKATTTPTEPASQDPQPTAAASTHNDQDSAQSKPVSASQEKASAQPTIGPSQAPQQAQQDQKANKTAIPVVKLIPADAATANVLAQQRRIDRLSAHIQNRYGVANEKARSIVDAAIRSAETHQLEPELLLAIIAVESTFNERAVSRVGARGLMQVMPGPHSDKVREIGGRQALFDPSKNIHTGAQILVEYMSNQSGNLRRALLRYNGSLNRPRSSYPDKVMRVYNDLRRATTLEAIASTVQG